MVSPKLLDLTAAALHLGGYNLRERPDGRKEIIFRHWTVTTSTGDKFTFCHYRKVWRRWTTPHAETVMSAHWRNASIPHQKQLTQWVQAHPDYMPDTPENRFTFAPES